MTARFVRRGMTALAIAVLAGSACADQSETTVADDDALSARDQAIADRMERLSNDFVKSSDLRLRIAFSRGELQREDNGSLRRDPTIPIDVLVDQARGSTDPIVLELLAARCSEGASDCDRGAILRRWTQADTQNQVAWLHLAGTLGARGDAPGARDAFLAAARATRWHEYSDDLTRVIAAALPNDLDDEERLSALFEARSVASVAIPFEVLRTLGVFCKEADAAVHDACARIVATMMRDSESLSALTVAPAYAARAGLPDLEVRRDKQRSDAIHWGTLELIRTIDPSVDARRPDNLPAALALQQRLIAEGERRAGERYLIDRHIPESVAAARYDEYLKACQAQDRAVPKQEQR